MPVEYDPNKSKSNKHKHGLDFEEAQLLWLDEQRIEFSLRTQGEARSLTIGRIGERVWAAIFTWREGRVRLISVRRARDEEREWYEDNIDG